MGSARRSSGLASAGCDSGRGVMTGGAGRGVFDSQTGGACGVGGDKGGVPTGMTVAFPLRTSTIEPHRGQNFVIIAISMAKTISSPHLHFVVNTYFSQSRQVLISEDIPLPPKSQQLRKI
jgi:hypothetical protein